MAYNQEKRDGLRSAYVYDKQDLRASAKIVGVTYATARRWKDAAQARGDNWDRARNAARIAQGNLGDLTSRVIEDFVHLFESTLDNLKKSGDQNPMESADAIAKLSDSYVKVMKAAGGSDKKLSELATAMKVLQSLSDYIRKEKPSLIHEFLDVLEPFGQQLSGELS